MRACLAGMALMAALQQCCAFLPLTTGRMAKSSGLLQQQAKQSPTGDFELQELKAQVEGMKKAGIASRSLAPTKRFELESYARAIIENKDSPVGLSEVGQRLPGTKWRLVFSTENASLANLPPDASVYLDFLDESSMEYSLRFSEKTAGLNSIMAESKWTADDKQNPGLITLVYDKITCDAFGFSNLGVGFFGLLKGRSSYVQSVYFDDDIWIDGGYADDGSTYFSVYTQEDNW
jgi:hypothetical protein